MNTVSDYYQVGGTVHRGAQSYIVRQADEELFAGLSQGEFCYVLDSRQIGKSSLMLRTAGRLREENVLAIILDLTALGQNLTAEQWYAGLLGQVSKELWQMDIDLEDLLDEYWLAHPQMGPFQRWMSALRDVVLAKTQQPIVIFVDEIDAVRSLPFSTDEFFAGIREGYNRRTRDPEFKRLTFCLLGVATPSDLMQEARMTPFNIGKRIELKDFTPEEATPLASGLGRDEQLAKKLLDRILYWTGGHPYLTQVLCRAVAQDPEIRNPAGVDRQCEKLFLSPRAREKDDNLLFVSRRILSGEVDRAGLLHLYETIRARKRTPDDETSPLVAHLRLAGLTRVLEGYLWVRNRIYFRVFDREWVNANMPDAEVRRQKAAFQRGLVRASLVAAVIIVSLLGGILWYWDGYLREHVTHYKNFGKRYGIPQGVGKLSTAQVSHRTSSFRFVTKGRYGPLLHVRAVNGSGALTPQHRVGTYLRYASEDTSTERECQWEFVLDPDNRVVYEIARDRFDRLVWGFVYSPVADVSSEAKPGKRRTHAKAHFVGPDGYPQPQRRSSAEYVDITYDKDGYEEKLTYTDRWGHPMPGLDRAYGKVQKFNRLGLRTETISLDQNGLPMVDEDGNAIQRSQYDEESGDLLGSKAFDADGNITRVNDGYAEEKIWNYDGNGNAGAVAYFGLEGKPTFHKNGYHKFTARYDERGNRIEERYFGPDDQPIPAKAGYHLWKAGYNARGNRIESTVFDTNEQPVVDLNSGVHRMKTVYDDKLGKVVEETYFGSDGKPTLYKDGFHKFTAGYNERGNRIEERYLGLDNQPILSKAGYHKFTARFDARGNRVEWAYFDTEERPVVDRDSGLHRISKVCDELGRVVLEAYFDPDGKPTLHKNGYHKFTALYDERGNRIEERYFGLDNQPIPTKAGYHLWKASYDVRGNRIEERYFGLDNQPILSKAGYHLWKASYDVRGKRIEERYFSLDSQPTLSKAGYHLWKTSYDARGNPVESSFFDTEERPVVDRDSGLHRISRVRDDLGGIVEEAYFNPDGKPTLQKNGFHKFTALYDERGNRIEERYFGLDSRPILSKAGYHLWKSSYDVLGKRIEERYFGLDSQPILSKAGYHLWKTSYDARGNSVESAFFDTEERPVADRDSGLHRISKVCDELGRIVEEAYFDPDGKPTLQKNGYHKFTALYNERGNRTEERYFGLDNQPIPTKAGYHLWKASYDERGYRIEERYFGLDNQPILLKAGYHLWKIVYDAPGNEIEWAYFDTEERPVADRDSGLHRIRKVRDELSRIVEEAYFNPDGKPTLHKNGFHKFTALYDERGNRIEERYFGPENQPVLSKAGYHIWKASYDARGKSIEERYFGLDNQPILSKAGYHLWKTSYDARGDPVESACFDTAERPVVDLDSGLHRISKVRDELGRIVEEAYFDPDGKPTLHKNGYHKFTARYDARGNLVEKTSFDLKGWRTVSDNSGVHRFDELGRVVLEAYYDPDGRPIVTKAGYHEYTARYDARGNQIEWAYFDTKERPVIDRDSGVHRISKVYDELGRVVQEAYFGPDGKTTRLSTARYDERGNRIEERYLDVDGSPLVYLIQIFEVFPNTEAMRVGLQPGDFVWSYGDWAFRTGDESPDVRLATDAFIAATRSPGNGLRKLLVIRGPSLVEFQVNPGRLGIRLGDFAMPDTWLRKVVSANPAFSSGPTPAEAMP